MASKAIKYWITKINSFSLKLITIGDHKNSKISTKNSSKENESNLNKNIKRYGDVFRNIMQQTRFISIKEIAIKFKAKKLNNLA